MAFNNFVPTLWATEILKDRDKMLVAANLCNRDYEGLIKEKGDKVKINGVGRPTISDYDDKTGLSDMERLADQSTMLEITQQKSFHFYAGDIDARQAQGDLMSAEKSEAAAGLAETMDSFIYSHYKDAGVKKSVDSLTTENIMSTLTAALTDLWKNNVPRNEKIYLEATPQFTEKLMLKNMLINTDNSDIIAKGASGTLKVFNMEVYMSTNIKTIGGAGADKGDYIFLRTKKAITLAEQITKVEAYRPEKYFGDAVKGIQVYGAKVIRPKELATIQVKAYGAESGI